ncbi:peroxidase 2 superfamily domain-containing protein [Histoplasma ohiense]|nr:peroxidase 2 superfamily domain-containing protein [Histoplasma ohiense (nom. inval.)]
MNSSLRKRKKINTAKRLRKICLPPSQHVRTCILIQPRNMEATKKATRICRITPPNSWMVVSCIREG